MIDVELWKNVLLDPAKTLKPLVKSAGLGEGLKLLAIGLVIAGLIQGLVQTILTGGTAAFNIVLAPIGMLIFGIIGMLVGVLVVWIVAKLLGGKGAYGAQFHLASLVVVPVMVINAVLSIVPLVGNLIGGLLSLYSLWPHIVAVREVHAVSTGRAAVAVLLPFVILAIVAFFFALLFAAVLGTILGAAGIAGLGALGRGA